MGIIIRQSIKSSMVTIIASLIAAFNIALLQFLLPKDLFGTYNLTITTALFIAELVLMMSGVLYFIFIKKYESNRFLEAGFNHALLKPTGIALICTSILYILYFIYLRDLAWFQKKEIFKYIGDHFITFSVLSLSLLGYSYFSTVLAAKQKNTLSSIAKDLVPRLFSLVIILLLVTKSIDMYMAIQVMMYQYLIGFMIAAAFIHYFGLFPWQQPRELKKQDLVEISNFRWTHLPFALIWSLSLQSIALIYTFYFNDGSAAYATFGVSIFMVSFMNIPYDQLGKSAISTLSQHMRDKDLAKVGSMYRRSNLTLCQYGGVISILIIGAIPFEIQLVGSKYQELIYIAPFLIFGKFLDMSTGFSTEIIVSSTYFKEIVRLSVIALLFLIGCYILLIPVLGDVGVAIAMMLWYLFFNIIKVRFVQNKFGLSPFTESKTQKTLWIIIPGIILIWLMLFSSCNYIIILLTGIVLSLIILYLLRRWHLNDDLIMLEKNILNRLAK